MVARFTMSLTAVAEGLVHVAGVDVEGDNVHDVVRCGPRPVVGGGYRKSRVSVAGAECHGYLPPESTLGGGGDAAHLPRGRGPQMGSQTSAWNSYAAYERTRADAQAKVSSQLVCGEKTMVE